MTARAMWKGVLVLGKQRAPVKLYSAAQDATVHFHLLHAKDQSPVQQVIVRKKDGKEVAGDAIRKAYPLDDGRAVILEPDDLETLEPKDSRDIELLRFVPAKAIGDQWYDRPYYLGPDEDDASYFALAQALARKQEVGVARWVMRKKAYLGALSVAGDYLVMSTLRRAQQVLSVPSVQADKAKAPTDAEVRLAEQLIDSITGDFHPEQWHNETHERLCRFIDAKAHGQKVKVLKPKPRAETSDLAASLRASIAAAKKEKRVA